MQKKLMRDKLRTENVEIRVIKWKKVWNNVIEEKWRDDTCCDCKDEKSRTTSDIKENSQPQYISWYHFLWKNKKKEIMDYFYRMGRMSYNLEWLGVFIFCFLMNYLLNMLFICCCIGLILYLFEFLKNNN